MDVFCNALMAAQISTISLIVFLIQAEMAYSWALF